MIDLGTLSIRDSSLVEARRKVSHVVAMLGLDPIGIACVVTGLSEVARRLFSIHPKFELTIAIRANPPRVEFMLTFTTKSFGQQEMGVMDLFDSVKRIESQGKRMIVCSKELRIHSRLLTPEFVERQRRVLRQKSRDELMKEMNAMNEDLWAKNLQLEEFAFSTAHTLKTDWLSVGYLVEEFVDVVNDEGNGEGIDEGSEAYDLLKEIKTRVARGARTVDELLMYSTLGNGVSKVPQSLLAVVSNVVTKLGNALLIVDPDFIDVVLDLDAEKFGIAVKEVLVNAITYGLGKLVDIQCDGRALRFRDHGRGIPKDSLVDIFGLFRRASTDGTGSGIGLAIAKQVIAAHGYRIWAESAGMGQGSTFVVDFSEE